jgi:hypothetical protein
VSVQMQARELAPIASNGPRLGGSTHGYTSYGAPNVDGARHVRVVHRGCLEHCRCRLKYTLRTLEGLAKKPCRSTHAPAGLQGLDPWVR